MLQPRKLEIPLAELTCRLRRRRIVQTLHLVVNGEIPVCIVQRERIFTTRPKAIQTVAVHTKHPVVRALRIAVRHALCLIFETFEVETNGSVDVHIAAALEIMLPVDAQRLCRSRVVKCRERTAKRVIRACVTHADTLALLGNRCCVGGRARPHTAVRQNAADREQIALTRGTGIVDECTVLIASRIAVAAVINTDIAPCTVSLVLDIDDKIRRPLPAACLQLRICLHA